MFIKNVLKKSLNRLSRNYIRYAPFSMGKLFLYHRMFKDYNIRISRHCTDSNPNPIKVNTILHNKIYLTHPDLVQRYIYFFGMWEPFITRYMCKTLSPGDIFVDIGANIGYHSLLASTLVGETGKVHAIEASPSIYELLTANISLNKIKNVFSYQTAVHNEHANIPVYMDHKNIGRTTICSNRAENRGFSLETLVEAKPLLEIVDEKDALSARLVKIDVEGNERYVVNGILSDLPDFSPSTEWIVEVDAGPDSDLNDAESIIDDFIKVGYIPYKIDNEYKPNKYIRKNLGDGLSTLTRPLVDETAILFTKKDLNV